jgi:alpha-ribazole phosphatase/probable phosphoglycerate mutase
VQHAVGELAGMQGTVLLLRHGETEWNRLRKVMGYLPVPLNVSGRAQCAGAIPFLRGGGACRIVTSPLVRARETAAIVAEGLGLPVAEDVRLSEVNFGAWAGSAYDDLVHEPAYQRYRADPLHHAPPGGETLRQVQERGLAAIRDALAGGPEPVLLVSHGDLIRTVLCALLGMDLTQYRRLRVDNCSVSAARAHDGWVRVHGVNMLADPARVWGAEPGGGVRAEL